MAYQHVLAAVDLSPESVQVLDRAEGEAARHDARLSVVTVVKPLTQVYGGIDAVPAAIAGAMGAAVSFEEQAMQQAARRLAELVQGRDVDVAATHVVLGVPAHDIREMARQLGADLIVIGTHGRHGLGRLLGSTASAVLHGVERDVLTVRVHFGD